ncbi:MAG: hypothetical protein Q4C02_08170, partial [Eubacteriales bacterium]|nr:hypothetical protein [Eubacteriales bacterium]
QIPFYPDLQTVTSRDGQQAEEGRGQQKGPAEPVLEEETIPADLPVLWGATARVTYALAQLLKKVPLKDLC